MGGGSPLALDFTGGASSGGNQQNDFGDFTGSQMVMNHSGTVSKSIMLGVVGIAAAAGLAIWGLSRI